MLFSRTEYIGRRRFEYRTFRWSIVEHCNYACTYCSTKSNNASINYSQNWEDIIDYFNRHDIKVVKLYGGEPTLHPHITKIIERFKNKIGIYTNLSKPLEFYHEYSSKFLDLNISCHYNSIRDINSYLQKVDCISRTNRVYVNVLLEAGNVDSILSVFDFLSDMFKGTHSRVTLSKVVGLNNYYKNLDIGAFKNRLNPTQYIEVQKTNSKKEVSEFDFPDISIDTFNFVCDMRKYFISVDKDGNFSNFCLNGKITDIYEDNFSLLRPKNILCCYHNSCLMHYLMIGKKSKL